MLKTQNLSHTLLLQANASPQKAAKAAHLVYVNGNTAGFTRKKKGKGFIYFSGSKILKNKRHLERIRKLAIPPSWTEVWICYSAQGHIQATGLDLRGRKQYRYHADWSKLRNETKFHHLYEFGKLLPKLRKRVSKDLHSKKMTQQKVLAAALDLMEKTYIRVGNESYEKENGSYGLTTLKDRHVTIRQDKLIVCFSGKKGVEHSISLKNKKLAQIVKQCRDIPGKALFQYYDDANKRHSIDSAMLNNYIKEATAPGFSAKDFRTWAGSLQAIEYYLSDKKTGEKNSAKTVPSMLDWVSQRLGNTRNVCKKYYIHPLLISLCEEKQPLDSLLGTVKNNNPRFSQSEALLMSVLNK
jgi:DNA topoisomerase-1